MPRISLIAAVARNRCIGANGTLPWSLPDDLRRFKELTLGKPVLMGAKTWASLPKRPLPGRRNVVLSYEKLEGVENYGSVPAALAALSEEPEIWVIGGAQVYAALLPYADRLVLTEIPKDVPGDAFFPAFGPEFREISRDRRPQFDFVEYVRT